MSNHPIILDVDTLTLRILFTPSPPADNAQITNFQKLQSSTLHGSKATETFLVWLLKKVKFKDVCEYVDGKVGSLFGL